jgi:hypothetical protein
MLQVVLAILALGVCTFTAIVVGDAHENLRGEYRAQLSGAAQVLIGVTGGSGDAAAEKTSTGLKVSVRYVQLSGPPTAITLQLGQAGVGGGVISVLCGGVASCPGVAGAITAEVTPPRLLAVHSRGVEAGSLTSVLKALDAGNLYVNVATAKFPAGEVRGQLLRGEPVSPD